MITTGKDGLIRPQFCAKMDQWVKKTIIIMLKLNCYGDKTLLMIDNDRKQFD